MSAHPLLVGVLALQGGVQAHQARLTALGARTRRVRRSEDLVGLDAIVLPGGESTTMTRLLDEWELRDPLVERLAGGLPAYGSCAGMILLAARVIGGRPDQVPLAAIDVTVRRNAFGRQRESFERAVDIEGLEVGGAFPAVFLRAPWIEEVGPSVQVLAAVDGHPVAARADRILITSFHPELSGDGRLHANFLAMVTA